MYARVVRDLTGDEERRLRALLVERSPPWPGSPGSMLVVGGVAVALCALTVHVSPGFAVPALLWVTVAILLPLSIWRAERRRYRAWRRTIERALRSKVVTETHLASTGAVVLGEDDFGQTWWAFQVEPDRLLFLGPLQDLTDPPVGFPTDDFSCVEFRDEDGTVVEMLFNLRGEALVPQREIDVENQAMIDPSRVLVPLPGRLDDVHHLP
jgi:hypothetical protein